MEGCKNCASTLKHLIKNYANIKEAELESELGIIHAPCNEINRVVKLLENSGWKIELNEMTLKSSLKESNQRGDDTYFVWDEKLSDNLSLLKPKRMRLDSECKDKISNDDDITQAEKLVAILGHEFECLNPHWVPGWCMFIEQGHRLNDIFQHLNAVKPLAENLSHIKRIDSCRIKSDKSVIIFLGIAEPSFSRQTAKDLVLSLYSTLKPYSMNEYSAFEPVPCWIPLFAPLSRQQQLLYSNSTDLHESRCFLRTNSLGTIVFGWPTTLRANPKLELLLKVGRDPSSSYFSKKEIERHTYWLSRVSHLAAEAQATCSNSLQSCAGFRGRPCAIIIVDPVSDCKLAEVTTPKNVEFVSFLDHASILAMSVVASSKSLPSTQHLKPYLCTGLDAYVSTEPCIMCGMALLHNRISRVFCCKKLKNTGSFTNLIRLHVLEKTNHRFQVFAPIQ